MGEKIVSDEHFEKILNIKTSGDQKVFYDSFHYNRYEATSYDALETLFKDYKLNESDSIVDFGCGKGRLNFYLNYSFNCHATGIEMNNYFYDMAFDNKKDYLKKHNKKEDKINFIKCFAENYEIKATDNKFYFFNPFSVQIFMKVLSNILISVEEFERTVDIILYYPSEDYIYYIEKCTAFTLKKEIRLPDLYELDGRERFLVYTLNF